MAASGGDPVAKTTLEAFGIKATPLHLADVNTGLETGMINRLRQYIWDRQLKNVRLIGSSMGALVPCYLSFRFRFDGLPLDSRCCNGPPRIVERG